MSANRPLRTLVVVIALCSWAVAFQSPAGEKATSSCKPGITVLPDGTIMRQNADCTVTKTPKSEIIQPPSEQSADDAPAKVPLNSPAAKLTQLKPEPLPPGLDDPALKTKYMQAMSGYFDYFTEGYAHRQRVFHWQLLSSEIIFVFVTLLVLSGIYFAALQFHMGLRHQAAASAAAGDKAQPAPEAVTTFSASAQGIQVSSPVLGVIILVISLAFFYMYLVYVYPITELF